MDREQHEYLSIAAFRQRGASLVGQCVVFLDLRFVASFACDAADSFGTALPLIQVVFRDPNPAGDTLGDFYAEEGSVLARLLPRFWVGEKIAAKGWVTLNPKTGRPAVLLKGAAAVRPMTIPARDETL